MKITKLDFPVMSSWMENNGRRLDCNPYLSGAFEAKVILEKLSAKKQPLHEVTKGGMKGIFHAGRESRQYVNDPDYGIPFLGSTDILAADFYGLPLLSKKQVKSNPNYTIQEGWTLITRSGTIGRMAYVRSEMDGMVCSEHAMRVVPDSKKILPGYLYAYLSSSFGVPIVISGTYGSIIQSIEPQHIADLPVPRLGKDIEETAHKNIEEAAKLRSEYQAQVKAATNRLFSVLGLKNMTTVDWHKMGSVLGFSHNLDSHVSLRAANFNPRFKKLCETIKFNKYKELYEICVPGTLQRGGRYKRIDADSEFGCQLIGQRQLFWLRPEGRWVAKSALGNVQP